MLDKNIDKDIDYFRNKIKVNNGIVKETRKSGDINAEALVADLDEESKRLENVLVELENLQDDLKIHEETSFDFQKENIELRKELEETIKELNEKDISIRMFKSELEKKDEKIKQLEREDREIKYKALAVKMTDSIVANCKGNSEHFTEIGYRKQYEECLKKLTMQETRR